MSNHEELFRLRHRCDRLEYELSLTKPKAMTFMFIYFTAMAAGCYLLINTPC